MADTAASIVTGGLELAGKQASYNTSLTAEGIVGNLINVVLGLSGLILVILLIYGGVLYMTAAGDMERVKQAKRTMINAVIGIVIVVAAYAAASFIIAQLTSAVTPGPLAPSQLEDTGCPPGQTCIN